MQEGHRLVRDAAGRPSASLSIASDVTPELARATIASVVVLGALHASSAVKDALADRMG